MFGSSLSIIVCRREYWLIYVICVCLCKVVSNTYCVVFRFICLRLVHGLLPVSLDCPFVLCTVCCQFLWIVPSSCARFVASFSGLSSSCARYVASFSGLSSSCARYVASFSGLSLRLVHGMLPVSLDCPFVLCTVCCQFLWIVSSVFSNVYLESPVLIMIMNKPSNFHQSKAPVKCLH
jgi:hypothetical protein